MQLMYVLKQLFESADLTKPDSSRETSAEIFVVCRGFKGQFSEIDPKMFDPEIVLSHKTVNETSMKQLVKDLDYNTRHRSGYDQSLNRTIIDCLQFIISESPILVLTTTSEIAFDFDLVEDHRFKSVHQKLLTEGFEFNGRSIQTMEDYMKLAALIKQNTDADMIQSLKDIKQLSKAQLQKLLTWHRKTFGLLCQTVPLVKAKDFTAKSDKATLDELVQQQEKQLEKEQNASQRKLTKMQQQKQLKQLKKFENFDKNAIDDVALDQQRESLFQIKKVDEDFLQNPQQLQEEKDEEIQEKEDSTLAVGDEQNVKFIYEHKDQEKFYDQFDQEMNTLYDEYITKLKR